MFFKTCSRALSHPGVPALAVAEMRFTISAVAGDRLGTLKGDALPISLPVPGCSTSLISLNRPLGVADVI